MWCHGGHAVPNTGRASPPSRSLCSALANQIGCSPTHSHLQLLLLLHQLALRRQPVQRILRLCVALQERQKGAKVTLRERQPGFSSLWPSLVCVQPPANQSTLATTPLLACFSSSSAPASHWPARASSPLCMPPARDVHTKSVLAAGQAWLLTSCCCATTGAKPCGNQHAMHGQNTATFPPVMMPALLISVPSRETTLWRCAEPKATSRACSAVSVMMVVLQGIE